MKPRGKHPKPVACPVCGCPPHFGESEHDTRDPQCRAKVRIGCWANPDSFDLDDQPVPVHDVYVHARTRARAVELWNESFGGAS